MIDPIERIGVSVAAKFQELGCDAPIPKARSKPLSSLLTIADRAAFDDYSARDPRTFDSEFDDENMLTVWASPSLAEKERRRVRKAFE